MGREDKGPPHTHTAVGSEERSSAKYSCSSSLQRVSTWRLLMKHYSWFHRCRARLRRLHFSHTLMWHLVLAGQWNRFWVANKNTVPRRQLIIGYPGQKKKIVVRTKGTAGCLHRWWRITQGVEAGDVQMEIVNAQCAVPLWDSVRRSWFSMERKYSQWTWVWWLGQLISSYFDLD